MEARTVVSLSVKRAAVGVTGADFRAVLCACGRCLMQHGTSPLSDDGSETLPPDALRRLVVDLSQRLGALEAQVAELRDELEKTEMAHATLHAENQDLRGEIARLKNLPPRPPFKPSGMEIVQDFCRYPNQG